MNKSRIYLSPPHMGGQELSYINEAFSTNWIAPLGPHVDAFENEFAQLVNSPHAAALSSGTAALHLALRLLNLQAGEDVFCSSLTFSASVNPILYEQGRPVFIGTERQSWNMDPALLEEAFRRFDRQGKRPRAVILVHLYGQSANLNAICEICERYEVPVIEDAAEALGAKYLSQEGSDKVEISPGTRGHFGIFSFNGNKIITTSGGGMLVSKDASLIERARFLATQARDPAPHYQHSQVGFNYRLSNVLAGIGRGQLRVLSEHVEKRRANFRFYEERLRHLPGIEFMPEPSWSRGSRWLTCITIDEKQFGGSREHVSQSLAKDNIESRPVWKPMHLQPIFAKYEAIESGVSEQLFNDGLCLPSGSSLSEEDLQRIVTIVENCQGRP